VVLRIADNRDAAAVGAYDVPLWHRVGRVVGALAVHVWLETLEQVCDRRPREHRHVVDAAQRRDELRACRGRQHRPAGPLERVHRVVVVDRDDEAIALRARALEIADVADVDDVEAAVRERDAPARASIGGHVLGELSLGDDRHSPGPRLFITASDSSAELTVAVPRFMTTSPPA
jgi:hypothetical protein